MALAEFHQPVVWYRPVEAAYQLCRVAMPFSASVKYFCCGRSGETPEAPIADTGMPPAMKNNITTANKKRIRFLLLKMQSMVFVRLYLVAAQGRSQRSRVPRNSKSFVSVMARTRTFLFCG